MPNVLILAVWWVLADYGGKNLRNRWVMSLKWNSERVTDGESDEKVEDEVGKKTDLYKTDPQNTFVHLSAMPKLSA